MKLSRHEQETIILYNQAEATAEALDPMTPGCWRSCGDWQRNTRTRL